MSLRLLIDEDSLAKVLVSMLRKAGHDVVTVNEAGFSGARDDLVFEYAIRSERILLTRNCDDFKALHQNNPNHPGIFAIYQDDNRSKNLSRSEIVKAILNIETSGIPLTNQFISLNQWRY